MLYISVQTTCNVLSLTYTGNEDGDRPEVIPDPLLGLLSHPSPFYLTTPSFILLYTTHTPRLPLPSPPFPPRNYNPFLSPPSHLPRPFLALPRHSPSPYPPPLSPSPFALSTNPQLCLYTPHPSRILYQEEGSHLHHINDYYRPSMILSLTQIPHPISKPTSTSLHLLQNSIFHESLT